MYYPVSLQSPRRVCVERRMTEGGYALLHGRGQGCVLPLSVAHSELWKHPQAGNLRRFYAMAFLCILFLQTVYDNSTVVGDC